MNWYKQAGVSLVPTFYNAEPLPYTLWDLSQGVFPLLWDKYGEEITMNHFLSPKPSEDKNVIGKIELLAGEMPQLPDGITINELVDDIKTALEELGGEVGGIHYVTQNDVLSDKDKKELMKAYQDRQLNDGQDSEDPPDFSKIVSIDFDITRNHNVEAREMEKIFNEDPPPQVDMSATSLQKILEDKLYMNVGPSIEWDAMTLNAQTIKSGLEKYLSSLDGKVDAAIEAQHSGELQRIQAVLSLCNWCISHGYEEISVV